MSRKEEILAAVDTLIQTHDEWVNDLQGPDVPTERLEFAIEEAVSVCDIGDTPEACRELATCVARLGVEWEAYKNGHMRPNHQPVDSLWGAFAAMMEARKGASPFVPKRPEPVSELVRQNVSHRQIALHIYGDGKTGPFVDKSGQPDIRLIQQEAEKPGSVVPADWVHPREVELLRKHQETFSRRLTAVKNLERNDECVDPATIEELLREGAYPNQVARAKRVPLEDVIAVMHKLAAEGVAVNGTIPNLAAMRAPSERQITAAQDAALQPRNSPLTAGTVEIDDEGDEDEEIASEAVGASSASSESSESTSDPAAIEQLVIELHQQHPEMGAGEISQAIKAELGETVGVRKVSAILRKSKAEAETVGA